MTSGEIQNIICEIIIVLLIFYIIYLIISKKNSINTNNCFILLKIIVVIHTILMLKNLMFWAYEFNLWALIILILLNLLVLIFNKKLSKNRIILIVSIILYLIFMFIIPVYKNEEHVHVFSSTETYINKDGKELPVESFKKYVIYSNCYNHITYVIK